MVINIRYTKSNKKKKLPKIIKWKTERGPESAKSKVSSKTRSRKTALTKPRIKNSVKCNFLRMTKITSFSISADFLVSFCELSQ